MASRAGSLPTVTSVTTIFIAAVVSTSSFHGSSTSQVKNCIQRGNTEGLTDLTIEINQGGVLFFNNSVKWVEPGYAVTGRAISNIGPIVVTVLVVQNFSLQDSGQFLLALTAITGVGILVPFGTNVLIIRTISGTVVSREEATQHFFSLGSSVLIVSALLTTVLVLFEPLFSFENQPLTYLWLCVIPVSLLGIVSSALKARGHVGWGGLWEIGVVSSLCSICIFILSPETALDVWYLYVASAWAALLASVGQAFALGVINRPLKWFVLADWRYYHEARYLGLIALLSYLSQWGGVLLASLMLNAEAVAVVNSLYRSLAPLQFAILTIDSYLAPKVAHASGRDVYSYLKRARILGLALALPYAIIAATNSDIVLQIFLGDSFSELRFDLIIIIGSTIVQIAFGPTGIVLNMKGLDKYTFWVLILKVSISFLGAIVVVPWVGVTGFFFMFALSTIIQAAIHYFFVRRNILSE